MRLLILAAILWSSSGLFVKATIFHDWPPEVRGTLLAFWRALFAGLLILPAVRRMSWRWQMLPMAIAFAAMNVVYLRSMTLTTAANAIWLQSTAPLWVFVLSAALGLERATRRDFVPLVLAMLGISVILFYELPGGQLPGILYGLTSAVGYAIVVLFLRALRNEDSVWLVVVNHLVTACLIAPYVIVQQRWPSGMQLGVLAAFGFIQMGLPYVLFTRGLKTVSSQEATLIVLLEPVLLPIWVYFAWGESPRWWTLVGGALILAGLLARYALPGKLETPAIVANEGSASERA